MQKSNGFELRSRPMAPPVEPEALTPSTSNDDELVLARFGKKQQLRVCLLCLDSMILC